LRSLSFKNSIYIPVWSFPELTLVFAVKLGRAIISHRTRVRNSLRRIGFDPAEQALMELRMTVFNTAQDVYLELQKTALSAAGGT
jgi:hypothetical protein